MRASTSSWLLISVCALGLSPIYPDIARDLRMGPDGLGAILGISSLVSAVLQMPIGVLADRFRLRNFIAFGLVCCGVAPVLWALAPDARVFSLGQVSMGLGIVSLQAGCITAVAKAYSDSGRAVAISYIWTASSVGLIASLIIFGVGGGAFGWRHVALAVSWLPLLAMPLAVTMPEPPAPRHHLSARALISQSARFFMGRQALLIAAVAILTAACGIATMFIIPFVLRGHSYSAAATGFLLLPFTLGGILGTPIIGNLADRFGARRPLVISIGLGALALVALAALGPQPPVLVVCFFVLGSLSNGGQALLMSITADLAAEVGGIGTGAALGIMRLAQSLGPAVAPTAAGYALLRFGAPETEIGIGVVLVTSAVLATTIGRNRRAHEVAALPPGDLGEASELRPGGVARFDSSVTPRKLELIWRHSFFNALGCATAELRSAADCRPR